MMLEMLENGCYRQYVIFFLCSMGDMILRCADDFISDIYKARPDSDPTPSGTILAIAVAITMAIAANADQLDSNCLAVVICWIWSHEQPQRNCAALNVCYCPSNSHHHCHRANDALPDIGNRRGTDTQRP
jgi:hypothetical protein